MTRTIAALLNAGITDDLSPEEAKQVHLINSMVVYSIPLAIIAVGFSLYLGVDNPLVVGAVVITVVIPPLVLWLNAGGRYILAKATSCIASIISVTLFTLAFGLASQFQLYLFALVGIPFVYFSVEHLVPRYIVTSLGVIAFLALGYYGETSNGWRIIVSEQILGTLGLVNILGAFFVLLLLLYLLNKENEVINTAQQRSQQLLTHRNRELTRKNAELEQFTRIASHDLNEPLRTIGGYISLIEEEYHTEKDEELDLCYQFIHEALDRMTTMIRILLDYAHLDNSVRLEELDVASFVAGARADNVQQLKDADVAFRESEFSPITGLPILRQVFTNLIANAIKFRAPNRPTVIEITQSESPDTWQFSVKDNGIGIDPTGAKRIFELFTQLHNRGEYEGHGIGLTFCRKIVEAHGGRIWVTSEPGEGSEFRFTVPKSPPLRVVAPPTL